MYGSQAEGLGGIHMTGGVNGYSGWIFLRDDDGEPINIQKYVK